MFCVIYIYIYIYIVCTFSNSIQADPVLLSQCGAHTLFKTKIFVSNLHCLDSGFFCSTGKQRRTREWRDFFSLSLSLSLSFFLFFLFFFFFFFFFPSFFCPWLIFLFMLSRELWKAWNSINARPHVWCGSMCWYEYDIVFCNSFSICI